MLLKIFPKEVFRFLQSVSECLYEGTNTKGGSLMEELQTSLCAIDGETLMDMPLALPRFCVGGLLPQRLSILGGAPKIGKSWLVLDLCVRIAKGEPIWNLDTIPGTTLYLCLEDPLHRVQQRLACVTDEAPANAYFATVAGSLADDLEEQILAFLREHPNTVLIVVDTFQMVRGSNGEPTYGSDYQEMQKLKRIADSQRISILLVHHLRKQGDRDPINKLSGTTGISGAADAIFVLEKDERRTDAAKLICTGRDSPENLLPGEMTAFLNFIKDAEFFSGGNSDLADAFNQHSGLNVNPKSLKQMMNRWRIPLQEQGITFHSYRSNTQRLVDVQYIPPVTKETQVTQRSGP